VGGKRVSPTGNTTAAEEHRRPGLSAKPARSLRLRSNAHRSFRPGRPPPEHGSAGAVRQTSPTVKAGQAGPVGLTSRAAAPGRLGGVNGDKQPGERFFECAASRSIEIGEREMEP